MDYRKIDDLVEKFWAGESTLAEEQLLKEMLASKVDVPEKYQEIASYFQMMNAEKESMQLDSDFDEDLLSKMQTEASSSKKKFKGVFYLRYYSKVAVILLAGLLSFKLYLISVEDPCIKESDPLACMDTFDNPEEAYELLKEQLLQVSVIMNKGQGEMSRISKFDEAQEILKENNR